MRRTFAILFGGAILLAGASRMEPLPAREQAAVDRISADSLRGNLAFLASDELEGRGTPSRGLDVAAEFIASQFRRAGLEPAGTGDSYFQNADFVEITPPADDFRLTLESGGEELSLTSSDVDVRSSRSLDFREAPVINLEHEDSVSVEGRVVAAPLGRYGSELALQRLRARKPALIVLVSSRPAKREKSFPEAADFAGAPVLLVGNEDARSVLAERRPITLSAHLSAPARKPFVLRNVAALLRGSDPVLRDQFVLLTAHYDHLGSFNGAVFNGANDNASGTVSVLEIAAALASLQPRPKRSFLFVALSGEEEGLLGAFYYTRHPLVPLKDTIADVNLEQMGRTDDSEGPRVGSFGVTGASYSNLAAIMEEGARAEAVAVFSKQHADDYFDRSDNYAFAMAGVVAHTIVVAFEYPEYHAAGDDWRKIDYANMAKVDRAVAAGLLKLADGVSSPRWADIRQTAPYRDATP